MRRKRFTEEQIIGILKEAESGVPVRELVRKYGVAEGTYYRWKSKFGGMEVSEAKRLRALEAENLKPVVRERRTFLNITDEIKAGICIDWERPP